MASLKCLAIEAGLEAPLFAGLRVVEPLDIQAAASAGDHVAIWKEGEWIHCVMGRNREGCVWCFRGTDSGVQEERMSAVCGRWGVVVLIEYEGGKRESSHEWARDQMAFMGEDTLQRMILRCTGGLEFAVRTRTVRCVPRRVSMQTAPASDACRRLHMLLQRACGSGDRE